MTIHRVQPMLDTRADRRLRAAHDLIVEHADHPACT